MVYVFSSVYKSKFSELKHTWHRFIILHANCLTTRPLSSSLVSFFVKRSLAVSSCPPLIICNHQYFVSIHCSTVWCNLRLKCRRTMDRRTNSVLGYVLLRTKSSWNLWSKRSYSCTLSCFWHPFSKELSNIHSFICFTKEKMLSTNLSTNVRKVPHSLTRFLQS